MLWNRSTPALARNVPFHPAGAVCLTETLPLRGSRGIPVFQSVGDTLAVLAVTLVAVQV
jgi:hypothetical protein